MSALSKFAKQILLVALIGLLLLVACGGDEEPTAVPPTATPVSAVATATTAPTEAPAAPVSPLGQPKSPLSTPISGTTDITETAPISPSVAPSTALNATQAQAVTPPPVPTSEPGKGTVTGRLVSSTSGTPLNHEVVRLAEVTCHEGVKEEDKRKECVWMLSNAFSPSTFTDENGFFTFNDLEPMEYVVIIGDMIGKNTKLKDDNGPFMWEAPADEVVDIGEYAIEW